MSSHIVLQRLVSRWRIQTYLGKLFQCSRSVGMMRVLGRSAWVTCMITADLHSTENFHRGRMSPENVDCATKKATKGCQTLQALWDCLQFQPLSHNGEKYIFLFKRVSSHISKEKKRKAFLSFRYIFFVLKLSSPDASNILYKAKTAAQSRVWESVFCPAWRLRLPNSNNSWFLMRILAQFVL